ncbi:MAG: hypothetical protein ACRDT2_07435 [Natronosporangium sp.]
MSGTGTSSTPAVALSAGEVDTAVADVRCKVETNLVGVLVGVTPEYEHRSRNWTP